MTSAHSLQGPRSRSDEATSRVHPRSRLDVSHAKLQVSKLTVIAETADIVEPCIRGCLYAVDAYFREPSLQECGPEVRMHSFQRLSHVRLAGAMGHMLAAWQGLHKLTRALFLLTPISGVQGTRES